MYPNQGYNNGYQAQNVGYASTGQYPMGQGYGMPNQNMNPYPTGGMSYGESTYLQQPNQGGYPQAQNPVVYNQVPQNNQQYWLNIPASANPAEDLAKASTVKVSQRTNCCEAITCSLCECSNIYDVIVEDNSNSQKHLFELEEINGCCWKCCAPAKCRSFQMDVKQVIDKNGQKTTTPYASIERPCKLGCLCCCEPEIYVKQNGVQVGKATIPCKCCGTEIHIFNEKGDHKYTMKMGCCTLGLCCGPCCAVRGDIYEANSEVIVGVISKECSACHCCTKADDYHLNFPNNATVAEKMNLIAGVILLDYRMFE